MLVNFYKIIFQLPYTKYWSKSKVFSKLNTSDMCILSYIPPPNPPVSIRMLPPSTIFSAMFLSKPLRSEAKIDKAGTLLIHDLARGGGVPAGPGVEHDGAVARL